MASAAEVYLERIWRMLGGTDEDPGGMNDIANVENVESVDLIDAVTNVVNVATVASVTNLAGITMPTLGPFHGQLNVTTPGTELVLAASQVLKSGVDIKAKTTNTGLMYVGANPVTSSTGYPLAAGQSVFIMIDNLNKIYVDCSVGGEGVAYIGT